MCLSREVIELFLFQNVLRELEQKKPQLDELVHTAESLKGADNRQQLHGKGNYLQYYLTFALYPLIWWQHTWITHLFDISGQVLLT